MGNRLTRIKFLQDANVKKLLMNFLIYSTIYLLVIITMQNTLPKSLGARITIVDWGNISQIIFGFSGGILSLTGLIAIFISLTSQHKIEKCRELHWQMIEAPNKTNNIFEIVNGIISSFFLYGKILTAKDDFVIMIIYVTRLAILFVLVMWAVFVGLINIHAFTLAEYISVIIGLLLSNLILVFFQHILGELQNFADIGQLPPLHCLMDVENNDNVRTGLVASLNTKMTIIGSNSQIKTLRLRKSLPINNYTLTLRAIEVYTPNKDGTLSHKRIFPKEEFKSQNSTTDIEHEISVNNWINTEQHIYNDEIITLIIGEEIKMEGKNIYLPLNLIKFELQFDIWPVNNTGDNFEVIYTIYGETLISSVQKDIVPMKIVYYNPHYCQVERELAPFEKRIEEEWS